MNTAEKSATFRKRRLSCPKHHLSEAAAAALAPVSEGTHHEDGVASHHEEENDKAHTFRKRRLSLTFAKPQHNDDDSTDGAPPAQKRRLSVASAASGGSSSAATGTAPPTLARHKSLTLHSTELLGGPLPPPSPAVHATNILYQQQPAPPPELTLNPTALENTAHLSKQQQKRILNPKWKKRHHPTDESKFPFPLHVVGTFSCHGVEPIYDSDYDDAEDEEEEEYQHNGDILDAFNQEYPVVEDTTSWDEASAGHVASGGGDANPHPADEQPPTVTQESVAASTTKPTMAAKINQDRGGIAFPYGNSRKTALFAVYDGHGQGGELVSQYALHEVQRRLEGHPDFAKDLERAFRETFVAVDDSLRQEPIIEPFYAGTTAVVALLRDSQLTLANAGDSRAVLAQRTGDKEWTATDLTQDQNPNSPEEQARIENMGGFVSTPPAPGLSARVWLDSEFTQIGLAMARSIGDHAIAEVGVISDPVVTTRTIQDKDDFMILASDGVWEFLSSQDAVNIVGEHLETRGATKACQALIEAAAARWHDEEGKYRDDITAIVVKLPGLWDEMAVSSQK